MFNPSSNKYTDALIELLSQFALKDWERQRNQEVTLKNIEAMKSQGLFGKDMSIPASSFDRPAIPSVYLKGINLQTGLPSIGFYSPQEQKAMGFQADVDRYMRARQEYKTGQGMTRGHFRALPPGERASFIKSRVANFPGATRALKELRPRFEGKNFMLTDKGQYKERASLTSDKPTVKVIGNSLIKYDPSNNKVNIMYEGKGKKQLKELVDGRIVEYDPISGKMKEIVNSAGQILEGASTTTTIKNKQYTSEQEKLITENMKAYPGKTREEIIEALISKGIL